MKKTMASNTISRYVWLLSTLLKEKQISFTELDNLWMNSGLGDGSRLAKRTFHTHVKEIEELFGVSIKCTRCGGYKYSISDENGALNNDRTRKWLYNTFKLTNEIMASHNMGDKIILEDTPSGTGYLTDIITAIQRCHTLQLDYQPFGGHMRTIHLNPYAMKIYHQRWYVVGYMKENQGIRQVALDRIFQMVVTPDEFEYPHDFNAHEYYKHSIGIYTNDSLKPQKVRLRVYGKMIDYIESLPIHPSQQLSSGKRPEYQDFTYNIHLTPELVTTILSMGDEVEVVEPEELKTDIYKRIQAMMRLYERQNHSSNQHSPPKNS